MNTRVDKMPAVNRDFTVTVSMSATFCLIIKAANESDAEHVAEMTCGLYFNHVPYWIRAEDELDRDVHVPEIFVDGWEVVDVEDDNTTQQRAQFDLGHKCGSIWAEREAESKQLKRLQEAINDDNGRPSYESMFDSELDSPWSATERLAFIILGTEPARCVSDDFWFDVGDGIDADDLHTSQFARGFSVGALKNAGLT